MEATLGSFPPTGTNLIYATVGMVNQMKAEVMETLRKEFTKSIETVQEGILDLCTSLGKVEEDIKDLKTKSLSASPVPEEKLNELIGMVDILSDQITRRFQKVRETQQKIMGEVRKLKKGDEDVEVITIEEEDDEDVGNGVQERSNGVEEMNESAEEINGHVEEEAETISVLVSPSKVRANSFVNEILTIPPKRPSTSSTPIQHMTPRIVPTPGINNHSRNTSNLSAFECVCGSTFPNLGRLEKHMNGDSGSVPKAKRSVPMARRTGVPTGPKSAQLRKLTASSASTASSKEASPPPPSAVAMKIRQRLKIGRARAPQGLINSPTPSSPRSSVCSNASEEIGSTTGSFGRSPSKTLNQ